MPVLSERTFFQLNPSVEGSHDTRLLFAPGDPGGLNFILPVLGEMTQKPDLDIIVMANNNTSKRLRKKLGSSVCQLPDSVIDTFNPELIVSGVEMDTREHAALWEKFHGIPKILTEDNYGTAAYYLEKGFRPDHLLTFSQVARDGMINAYGKRINDLDKRIEVTGHPAIDESLDEELIKIRRKATREQLGLADEETLLACFATIGAVQLVKQFANELTKSPRDNLKVVFNKHPRDPRDAKEYWEIFEDAFEGTDITFCRTDDNLEYTELLAAAEAAVILPFSTTASHAILQIPTIHVQLSERSPIPDQMPVVFKASPLVTPDKFMPALTKLLDPTDPEAAIRRKRAEILYPLDNRSTSRVTSSILEAVARMRSEEAA